MRVIAYRFRLCIGIAAALLLALVAAPGHAADNPVVMKISVPTINDAPHEFSKRLAAAAEKDSGGRIKAEVYPASQLGSIPRQIEGCQFGAIQVCVIPPDFFVGIDERFEVMAAPGLIDSMQQGEKLVADPAVQKLMLGLGAEKGLHGAAMFIAAQSTVVSKNAIRHLADFKGKKIRIFASDFAKTAWERLGAAPVAMSLGDVLPALQQGTIDAAIAATPVFANFHYQDAAKYITVTNQPAIFIMAEFSAKWFAGLPPDLQKILGDDAAQIATAVMPWAIDYNATQDGAWTSKGGELIHLPPGEQASMMATLISVGADVSKTKPNVKAAYDVVTAAAKRAR
ncbi:MAG TPA: TRAP transporter substrate-binding protein [Stellaceae bacterium]